MIVRRELYRGSEEMVLNYMWDVLTSAHDQVVHRRLCIKLIPRFVGVLVSIGGKRTLLASTSHFMCCPSGTSGSCIVRISK